MLTSFLSLLIENSGETVHVIYWALLTPPKVSFNFGLQFSSVTQWSLTLCNPMDCRTGSPVHQQLPEPTQTHVHCTGDAIQPSHPLLSPSPPAFSVAQHQGIFQWVGSLHHVAKVLEIQLQHQSFQWIFRVYFF